MAKLEAKNLTISFRTNNGMVRAVRDVSFSLHGGETLAIAGESGSGKSVTARAIMGILTGNAVVDNGEIIYDGRDLLKIPEEDFHTLRGHKLSMVFQDPLSALNPVMRIGRQLTEAMMLNNRERRRDGRARFNKMLALLEKNMLEARGGAGDAGIMIRERMKTFNRFASVAVKREQAYEAARAAAVEAEDGIAEIEAYLATDEVKPAKAAVRRLCRMLSRVCDDLFIPAADASYKAASLRLAEAGKAASRRHTEPLTEALAAMKAVIAAGRAKDKPDFFSIGYWTAQGRTLDLTRQGIAEANALTAEALEREFLAAFLKDVEAALAHSRAKSTTKKKEAIRVLEAEARVFASDPLTEKGSAAALARAAQAVEATIDPLRLEKDNLSHVFKSSVKAYIERYFRGVRNNPKEEKRFRRDTLRYAQWTRKGKVAANVVPINQIDIGAARDNILRAIRELTERYKAEEASSGEGDTTLAAAMVLYLRARASEYAYKLSGGVARHRALELMNEVGIPDAAKRFKQYPFEFSGGMRQRIVIAIALSANPDILICDEPTTALDVTIQAQILELINGLKKERKLSVIFITHDLGVVANMADRIAVMYAGKIVEYGTAEEVFYDPRHPYTWALLSSMPDLETKEKLTAIPGTPPDMIYPPKGDAFAPRNHYAMAIDFEEQPPLFRVTDTHVAATWLLHPAAPRPEMPPIVKERIDRARRMQTERTRAAVGNAEKEGVKQ